METKKRLISTKKKKIKIKINEDDDIEKLKKQVEDLKQQLENAKKGRKKVKKTYIPPRKEGDPLKIGNKPLQKHQIAFIENFLKSPTRGALAIHGVGSGKTLTAVISAEKYLQEKPNNKIIVITPASLLNNFKQELYEYDAGIQGDDRYIFYTFDGFSRAYMRGETDCRNAMLIIDEAQNLRTKIRYKESLNLKRLSQDGVEEIMVEIVGGKKVLNILEGCGLDADKILLLSATPLVNSPYDIENLMAIINGHKPLNDKSFPFSRIWENPEIAKKYFNCRLSFFKQPKEILDKFYPKVEERLVPIIMNKKTLKEYEEVENLNLSSELAEKFNVSMDELQKLRSFYNGLRKASNALGDERSQKVDFIIDWIKGVLNKKPNKKIGLTKKIIDTHTDKSVIFTHFLGSGSDLIIKRLKKAKIPYGAINGSISKGKRAEIVKKYVDGDIKVILISKAGAEGLNLLETGYLFLVEPSWNNTEREQVKGRGVRFKSHINLPKEKQNVLILSLFLVKPDEAKQFEKLINPNDKDYGDFAGFILKNTPKDGIKMGVDMFLYRKSNAKQDFLDKALMNLQNFEHVENCKSDKNFLDVSNIFELGRETEIPPLTEWEEDFYKKDTTNNDREMIKFIDNSEKKEKIKMRDFREKMKSITRTIFSGDKFKVQSQNAFFTPPEIAIDMVEFSGIDKAKNDIVFLEPTAGAGFIIYEALLKNEKIYCEAIENLKPLADFVNNFPRTISLKYDNYFDLPKNKKYRVILMNPPFNIAKGKALENRSAKDVDFVLDAFNNHLEDEGILVCLISNSYLFRGLDSKRKSDVRIYQPFRDLLDENEHYIIPYESGFSKGVVEEMKTGVKMVMIKILKKKN